MAVLRASQGHVERLRPLGSLPDALSATVYIAMAMPALSPFVPIYKVGSRGHAPAKPAVAARLQAAPVAPPDPHRCFAADASLGHGSLSYPRLQGLPAKALPPALATRAGRDPDRVSLFWKARRLQAGRQPGSP